MTSASFLWLLAGLLAAGDGLLRALAGTGVGPGPLTADREAPAVTDPLVAADLHLALDVALHLTAEVTLHLEALVDPRAQPGDLLLGEVAHPGVGRDRDRLAHLLRG